MKFDVNTTTAEIEEIGESFKNKKAKISEKNSPYIFSLLSNIYSKPIRSATREITSNCFDAHIEAGTPYEPVLIRLYADDTSQLHVEFIDNGLGISPDKMDDVFMSYGESTKRDSDDFIGAFGLGSKSPFAYSPYFYVITKTNGLEHTYLMNQTVLGPEYDCLMTKSVEDGSTGTIIRIPIKSQDLPAWKQAMIEELKYFKNVYFVNLDGLKNDHVIKKFKTFQIREDLFKANVHASLHLVLGDVTYPIRFDELGVKNINFNGALTFKIGELDVTPNREEVKYTPKSKTAIINKLNEFQSEILNIINNPVNFEFDDLYEYHGAQHNLDKNNIFNIHTIIDEPVSFNLNNFTLISKGNVKLVLKVDGNLIKLNYNELSPEKHTTLLYKRHKGSSTFTLLNPKSRIKNQFSYFKLNKESVTRYVFVESDKKTFKLSERRWMNDNQYTDILYFNKKEYRNMVVDNIMKNNGLKHIYSDVVTAINIFNKIWVEIESKSIYRSFNSDFKDFVIPLKYGIEKRSSIKKKEDTILYFECDNHGFVRREILPVDFKTKFPSTVIVGDHKLTNDLFRIKRYLSFLNLNVIYCAKKYQKQLLQLPDVYHINDLASNGFYQKQEIKDVLQTQIEIEVYNKIYKSFEFEFSSSELSFILRTLSKNSDFVKILQSLSKQIFSQSVKVPDQHLSNYLSKLFDKDYLKDVTKKCEEKTLILFNKNKIYQKFERDFYLELKKASELDCEEEDVVSEMVEKIQHSIKLKKTKLNNYLKLINK